ncbi:MAG: GNAT family N-acetyltransferase [Sphingomonadales bacterium]|nr:GNAT family N-acetyltransferase [Sphingomonadales bacterium]MDE2567682.1 GNAT family N-acetyltransferase [Sphingomonadales bacterium]
MSLTVRRLHPGDREAWTPLWDGYNAFYGREGATALPAAVTERTWSRFFDACEPVHALVAETGDALVGLAHYVLHRSTSAIEPSLYLQDLFTAPGSRGMGVARTLIEAIYAEAGALGAGRVYWQTHESNETARRVYDRLAENSGFIVYRHLLS